MSKHIFICSCLTMFLFGMGCSHNSIQSPSGVTANAAKVYEEEELNALIVPGMGFTELTNILGVPSAETSLAASSSILIYSYPPDYVFREGTRLSGFTVNIKDDKVVRWSPIISQIGGGDNVGDPQGSYGVQEFELFIVAGSLTDIFETFQSEGSADISDLQIAPDMAFEATVFAGDNFNPEAPPGQQLVYIVLEDQDVPKFKILTEDNYDKHLLIAHNKKVIAAPRITEPVPTNKFTFTVKNSKVLENFRERRVRE